MTRQAPKAPPLAALLSRHQDDIATTWAEMAHNLSSTRYAEHSVAEIRSWLSHGIATAVETLSTGSYAATEDYLRELSHTRLQMEFDISEVTEGLLLLKEATLPVIQHAFPTGSAVSQDAITALETYLRYTVGRFGHLYAEAMEKELRGTYLKARFDKPVKDILHTIIYNGIAHHASMVYGDYIKPIEIFGRISGIPVIR